MPCRQPAGLQTEPAVAHVAGVGDGQAGEGDGQHTDDPRRSLSEREPPENKPPHGGLSISRAGRPALALLGGRVRRLFVKSDTDYRIETTPSRD